MAKFRPIWSPCTRPRFRPANAPLMLQYQQNDENTILHCHFAMSFCIVILQCHFAMSFCTAILHCHFAMSFCNVILLCIFAMYMLTFATHMLMHFRWCHDIQRNATMHNATQQNIDLHNNGKMQHSAS